MNCVMAIDRPLQVSWFAIAGLALWSRLVHLVWVKGQAGLPHQYVRHDDVV